MEKDKKEKINSSDTEEVKLLKKIYKNIKSNDRSIGVEKPDKGYMTLRDEECPEELMDKKTDSEVTMTIKAKITDISKNRYGPDNKEHRSVSFDIVDLIDYED